MVAQNEAERQAMVLPGGGGLDRRFDRLARLVGEESLRRLQQAHVMVVGVGGVGSWAAESLVRSGIGTLTLVDFDDVCVTNFNRQLHALGGRIGEPKAAVMAERLRQVNPSAVVQVEDCFYGLETAERVLAHRPDFVVDAIDCVSSKCHLLAACRARGIRVVCSTGSGGRLDPTCIAVADLSRTDVDPLARMVRKILRREYGFPREQKGSFGIPAVYSREDPAPPRELPSDGGSARRCFCTARNSEFFNCDDRNVILGSAAFVTGAFGLHCAAVAVRALLEPQETWNPLPSTADGRNE
jgi:tRNA A37 threonylcarbamoyladenosine dehydratase